MVVAVVVVVVVVVVGGGGFTNPDEKQYPSFKNTYCFPKGASEETREQVGFSREEIL